MQMNAGEDAPAEQGGGFDKRGLFVTAICAVVMLIAWSAELDLLFLLAAGVVIAIVIWQACDPFAEAAQWVGKALHLPGSVRGATLDAIASSMPELFSGIFFVIVAIQSVQGNADSNVLAEAGAEGYGSTIATCAGSAVYNMILIPASVALVVSFRRRSRPTVDVESEVLSRDGMWFLVCEIVLLVFLFQDQMHWWMGPVFLAMYAVYIMHLYFDGMSHRRAVQAIDALLKERGSDTDRGDLREALQEQGIKATEDLISARVDVQRGAEDEEEEDAPDETPALFGLFNVPLTKFTVPMVLLACTAVAAVACYFLVEVTHDTADLLGVPPFFVAVILAAAVSSVPDTFLSVGAAMRCDDSGAVSNAFGSNIFDICICLSIPLLVNAYLLGWEPVSMVQQNPDTGEMEPLTGLFGLRILLCVLTVVTLAIFWHRRQLTRGKALILVALYLVFVSYAVVGSLGILAL